MRKSVITGAITLVGLALVISVLSFQGSGIQASRPTAAQLAYPGPTVIPSQDPAPDPILEAANRPVSTPGISAISPPVTEAKMREYITHNPSIGGISAQSVQVTSVQFLTAAELRLVLGNRGYLKNLSPSEQLVYVRLSGAFVTEDPVGAQTNQSSAYRVFSAVTGNELFGGTLVNK